MKSFFAFVFALILSTSAFAGENEANFSVSPLGKTTKFALSYANPNAEQISISIYNENNKLVHSEKINSKEAARRIYDLSAFGEGTYKVILLDKETKETQLVTIGAPKVIESFVAMFGTEVSQDHILVSLNNNKGEVELRLSDEEGNILYTQAFSEEKGSKSFNVEKLPSGWYTLEVIGADKTVSNIYYIP